MKSRKLFLLTSTAVILLFTGCKQGKKATAWNPPSDEFAFVEYYITYEGKALQGTPPPGMRIDGPTYMFNSETGEINSYMESNFSIDTVSTILGTGRIRRGTEGGGLSSRLVGIRTLPFSEASITLLGFSNEKMYFKFKEENLELKLGEEWQNVIESVDTIPSLEGYSVVQRKIIHQLNFRGFYKKDSVKLSGN